MYAYKKLEKVVEEDNDSLSRPTVPAEARPVLLPAVAAQAALDGLRKANFDVFDPRLNRGVLGSPPLWFQLKLKWHSLRGKY